MTTLVAGIGLSSIAKPVASILAYIYEVVPNYGVAIMLLALGWMILISPLTLKTTRSMLAMQRLQPQLKKLQEQHRNDRQALSQATMDLYKQEGVSPFGSCLPTLLPLPVFFALFRVIDGLSTHVGTKAVPKYLSPSTQMYKDIVKANGHLNAFGVDLSQNVLTKHTGTLGAAPYVLLLLIMMGTQYWQTVSMMNRNPANADNPQARMMKYLPLIFGVVSVRFPAGVILYYATSNVCRIAQQYLMYNFDPKVKALAVQDARAIDVEAREIENGTRARTTPTEPAPARTRFRDLLANAAEQQQQRKAATGTSNGNGTARPAAARPAKAATNGAGGAGGARNGSAKPATTPAGNGNGAASEHGASRPRTGAASGRTGAARPSKSKKRRGR